MCRDEQIPRVGYVGQIASILERSHDPTDIHALSNPDTPEEIVEEHNRQVSSLNGETALSMLDEGNRWSMQYITPEDYEAIFDYPGLSRRSAREWKDPRDVEAIEETDWMLCWCENCLDNPSRATDWIEPDFMEIFDTIFERYLPPRLDLSTWIADQLLHTVAERISGEAYSLDVFREWDPSLGDGRAICKQLSNGCFQDVVPFLGVAEPGRLIWMPQDGFTIPYSEFLRTKYLDISAELRKAEKALITLARRIAKDLVVAIYERYVEPQFHDHGRAVLERRQVGFAVREILGEAWFNLPFDVDDELRNWSEDDVLKPDHEMEMGGIYINARADFGEEGNPL